MNPKQALWTAASAAALAVLAACGDGGSPRGPTQPQPEPVPAAIAPASPVAAAGPVASTMEARVRVTAVSGAPVSGVAVTFTVAAGGGTVSAATVHTDAAGEAAVAWKLGTAVGENRLQAAAAGLAPVVFTAAAAPGPAAALRVRVQPAGARVALPLGTQPVVEVHDAYGNRVESALTVTASVPGGALAGGTVAAAGGVATFTDLSLHGPVGPRQISFGATGLPAVLSEPVLLAPPPRSLADRPDDLAGAQIRVLYVLPSDGADREFDTGVQLAYSVASFQNWLAARTGGRALRMDTYSGAVDVGFFRLSRTDAGMQALGAFVRDEIERQLKAAGMLAAGKLYLVYYDGGSTYSCGGASWPPRLPGQVAAMYLRGTPAGLPADRVCGTNAFASSPQAFPRYWEFAALHDMLHTLGIVSPQAPHHTAAYPAHVPEPHDLMYAGPAPWDLGASTTIDTGADDYAGTGLPATLPNLLTSPYLAPAAASLHAASLYAGAMEAAPAQIPALPPHPPFTFGHP